MEVMLVNSRARGAVFDNGETPVLQAAPPLGLAYIAAILEQQGYLVNITCLLGERLMRKDLEERLKQLQPRILGLNSLVCSHNSSLKIAEMAKKIVPGIIIIVGGPHVSFLVEETLRSGSVDVVCRFEGEHTMLELADYYLRGIGTLEAIRGIAYLEDDMVRITPDRPFIEDLDGLPFPARHLLRLNGGYVYPGSIVTGRGCPFGCIFCAANNISGSRCRMRSAENVLDELEEIYGHYNIDKISFMDDTFVVQRQRVKAICEGIINRKLPLEWFCETRANTVSEELLRLMYEAGCRAMQFGVESGNDEILKKINKGITTAQVENAVETAMRIGIRITCSMIIGHPDDTHETVEETIRFGEKLVAMAQKCGGGLRVVFPILTPLPGSYVYEHADELGIKMLTNNWDRFSFIDPVIETTHLSRHDLHNYMLRAMMRCPEQHSGSARSLA